VGNDKLSRGDKGLPADLSAEATANEEASAQAGVCYQVSCQSLPPSPTNSLTAEAQRSRRRKPLFISLRSPRLCGEKFYTFFTF
jgi:hypothetical protein